MGKLTPEQIAHDIAIAVVAAQLINPNLDPSVYAKAQSLYSQAKINLDALLGVANSQ